MHKCYLLLGTNLGDKSVNLSTAIAMIGEEIGQVTVKSSVYRTAAWGKENQDDFLNQVLEVTSDKAAEEVLTCCLAIEKEMGRVRYEKWGERLIDIDVLYYDREVISTDVLSVPHPHLHERRFTLVPLVEIAPEYVHPKLNQTHVQLLGSCPDQLEVLRESI